MTVRWAIAACVLAIAPNAQAQSIEITPFGGYRFGGGFFEVLTSQPVDLDGAATLGVIVDIAIFNDVQIEGAFSHQRAELAVSTSPFVPPAMWEVTIDHWLAGALKEIDGGRVRPFVTGMLGLTRYADVQDSEIRFTGSAGGGVKLLPTRRIGVRLDGRVFATIIDGGGRVYACSNGRCLLSLYADIVWQAEFTAGVVLRLN